MSCWLSFSLLAPTLALAAPVSFKFDNVSLVSFGQATFKAIMNRDFVIGPDVVGLDKRITINVKSIETADVPRFVESMLAEQGIQTTLKDGVYYLSMRRDAIAAASNMYRERPAPVASVAGVPVGASVVASQIASPPGTAAAIAHENMYGTRKDDDETTVYTPSNRPPEFMASVVAAAFGPNAAQLAGPHVVINGSKANMKKITALLQALDTVPKRVDVAASWIEVAQNSGSGRGISLVANVLGAKFGASLGNVTGSSVSLKNTNFELVIEALNSDGRFKQVSNSRITADDYQKPNLTVGDETPTVSSNASDNAGNPVQNIVYRPSGVIINVVPKVLGSGRVNMAIDGQISSFKATATGVTGSPTLIKRQVTTNVTVDDGEVLVIGGLNDTQTTDSAQGFAFLPSSWTVKNGTKVQTDLVLILSAKVAANERQKL
jgi:type II secretory pathway component GspD/PulD (secretin)